MLAAIGVATATAQTMSIAVVGPALQVKAPAFTIVDGAILERLKDGRSVRVDVELTALGAPGGRHIADDRQSFQLSFDLWEERFVATRTGTPPRSSSFARAADADAWCVANLTIPLASLGRQGRDTPIWMRLTYRASDPSEAANADADEGFSLRALIDRLSRKDAAAQITRSVESGPFRLP